MMPHTLTTLAIAATLPPLSLTAAATLRILPLGASVTYGVGSPTGNSYRKPLLDILTASNHTVHYVGRSRNGNFSNNQVEATSGFVFSQIATAAREATPLFLPNVILIEAGTNDCNRGALLPDLGRQMKGLVQELWGLSPGVTVVVATLGVNKVEAQDVCRMDVNRQYKSLVEGLAGEGGRVVLADMRSAEGFTVEDLADTRHPNDGGYAKMAVVWSRGVEEALGKGMVGVPVGFGGSVVMAVGGMSVGGMSVGGRAALGVVEMWTMLCVGVLCSVMLLV
ncbi:GDSL-like Lipase/Acylhydrolase [Podospora aff. communis PSN243]|uniref:GDSL-like Lipase/Acylhydrolase n=1 Tax=Podospora aff. communis PSN243 TaxID=3040156 RepID=A0AAV9G6A1_9PEZI|nr:GDSL-like Lipase/Acylhydrolase [Podospora aff. communis PSN243]